MAEDTGALRISMCDAGPGSSPICQTISNWKLLCLIPLAGYSAIELWLWISSEELQQRKVALPMFASVELYSAPDMWYNKRKKKQDKCVSKSFCCWLVLWVQALADADLEKKNKCITQLSFCFLIGLSVKMTSLQPVAWEIGIKLLTI